MKEPGNVERGVIMDLLSCNPFARVGGLLWEPFFETVVELGRMGHRKETDANDAAFQIRKMQSSMDEHIFKTLTEYQEDAVKLSYRAPNGDLIHSCQSHTWEMFCPSPVSLDKADYPPHTWPLWCNGRQTVYMSEEYSSVHDKVVIKIVVNNHGGK